MEADWAMEIGPGLPIIDGLWTGFVDLRKSPQAIGLIEEVGRFPALGEALLRINLGEALPRINLDRRRLDAAAEVYPLERTPLWSSKCDVWSIGQCDGDEFEASPEDSRAGIACYIDVMPREGVVFQDALMAERWARALVDRLKRVSGVRCRVDLMIRRAVAGDCAGFGVSAYLSGCGGDESQARIALIGALGRFTEILVAD